MKSGSRRPSADSTSSNPARSSVSPRSRFSGGPVDLGKLEFHPEAEAELVSAAQYFESHVEHLGLDFIVAVRRASERILEFLDSGRRSVVDSGGPSSGASPTACSTASSRRVFSSWRSPICIDGQVTGGRVSEEGSASARWAEPPLLVRSAHASQCGRRVPRHARGAGRRAGGYPARPRLREPRAIAYWRQTLKFA